MTEQYTPSDYDLHVQNPRIDQLESLITAEYQPPTGAEYSYPVANQGITQEQFRTMMRAAGSGVYVQHDPGAAQSAYLLVGMPGGDSETNATNQMILKVASPTGRNEAVIDGFFHTQTEDIPISFPAVTAPTTYYLCLTYDPRREKEPEGPIRITVYVNDLPRTHGRKHIVLWTVEREPNQLLSQARVQHSLSWVSPVISAFSLRSLPDPASVVYGTIGVVIHGAGANVPTMYASRGHHGWIPIISGEWETITDLGAGVTTREGRPPKILRTTTGFKLSGVVQVENTSGRILRVPSNYRLWSGRREVVLNVSAGNNLVVPGRFTEDGNLNFRAPDSESYSWVSLDGVEVIF